MKPEELMIGDWVNFLIDIEGGDTDYDPKVAQYQPMKIVSLSSWYNNDGEVESAEGVINDIDQVKPIPLTPEILEQNGFEYYDNPVKSLMTNTINGHYVEIRLDRKEMAIWYDYDENNDGVYSDCLFPLPYWLHDFQHALRLCGINKEIDFLNDIRKL